MKCIACDGSGISSRSEECYPCKGTGKLEEEERLIQHSSATNEHYTPNREDWPIVSSIREVLGGSIELDPASCKAAQVIIEADVWYGKDSPHGENGLRDGTEPRVWHGRTLLNPPGGLRDENGNVVIRSKRGKNGHPGCNKTGSCGLPPGHQHRGVQSSAVYWWERLLESYSNGTVTSAVFVAFSYEMIRTSQGATMWCLEFPTAWPSSRVPYDKLNAVGDREKSTSPPASSFFTLLPESAEQIELFKEVFGRFGQVLAL